MADEKVTPVFSATNLPKIIDGTSGHALPKPAVKVAVCRVPVQTKMSTPWGQELEACPEKHYHMAQDAVGDHYPNDEFETFYTVGRELSADDDPKAKFLIDFWAERGHKVTVYEAEKTKPALVVGVLAEDGKFENVEGCTPFKQGDLILGSPEIPDRMWIIRCEVFCKKYQGIRQGSPS